jgi:hypothetical protein
MGAYLSCIQVGTDEQVYPVEIGVLGKYNSLRFQCYLNPPVDVPRSVRLRHNINDREIRRAPEIDDVFDVLIEELEDAESVYGYRVAGQRKALKNAVQNKSIDGGLQALGALDWTDLQKEAVEHKAVKGRDPSLRRACRNLGVQVRNGELAGSVQRARLCRQIHMEVGKSQSKTANIPGFELDTDDPEKDESEEAGKGAGAEKSQNTRTSDRERPGPGSRLEPTGKSPTGGSSRNRKSRGGADGDNQLNPQGSSLKIKRPSEDKETLPEAKADRSQKETNDFPSSASLLDIASRGIADGRKWPYEMRPRVFVGVESIGAHRSQVLIGVAVLGMDGDILMNARMRPKLHNFFKHYLPRAALAKKDLTVEVRRPRPERDLSEKWYGQKQSSMKPPFRFLFSNGTEPDERGAATRYSLFGKPPRKSEIDYHPVSLYESLKGAPWFSRVIPKLKSTLETETVWTYRSRNVFSLIENTARLAENKEVLRWVEQLSTQGVWESLDRFLFEDKGDLFLDDVIQKRGISIDGVNTEDMRPAVLQAYRQQSLYKDILD